MIIGIISVDLHIPDSQSLKDKRQVVKSLISRTRNKFNVSMAEIGGQDKWQRALIGIVSVGNEKRFVNQVLDRVMNFIRSVPFVNLIGYQIEFL
jgi:hypothetical protein